MGSVLCLLGFEAGRKREWSKSNLEICVIYWRWEQERKGEIQQVVCYGHECKTEGLDLEELKER